MPAGHTWILDQSVDVKILGQSDQSLVELILGSKPAFGSFSQSCEVHDWLCREHRLGPPTKSVGPVGEAQWLVLSIFFVVRFGDPTPLPDHQKDEAMLLGSVLPRDRKPESAEDSQGLWHREVGHREGPGISSKLPRPDVRPVPNHARPEKCEAAERDLQQLICLLDAIMKEKAD